MNNLKYLAGLLILLAVSCTKPLTEEQKNADSVLLKQVHEYTLNTDGSTDYHYYHQRAYNTYQSFHRYYGESFVIYNPNNQVLTINKSETKMADGKMVQSPENAFNLVLPFQAANAPAYNHLREMVITHVGLEIGAVVEFDYTLHSDAGVSPFFAQKILLNESSPVKELEIVVRVPKGENLNYFVTNQSDNIKTNKVTKGDFDVYTWKASELKALSNESHQVEGLADYQTLVFSNVDLAEGNGILSEALTKEFSPDDSMKEFLQGKSKTCADVEAIRSYVVGSMNSYWVEPAYCGYQFRSPAEVWASNGGTEAEKAILLASMLKHIGLNANVAMAAYPIYLDKTVGCPAAFEKYLVKVDVEGEAKYLDVLSNRGQVPTSMVIVSTNEDISTLDFNIAEPAKQTAEFKAELNLTSKGVIVDGTLALSDYAKAKGLLTNIPNSQLVTTENTDTEDLTVITVTSKALNTLQAGDYISYSLPRITQGLASANLHELATERVTRLELPNALDETYQFTIKLEPGFEFVSPEHNEVVENEAGKVSVSYTLNNEELLINRSLVVNQRIIPINQYEAFRNLYSVWMDQNLNSIQVRKL